MESLVFLESFKWSSLLCRSRSSCFILSSNSLCSSVTRGFLVSGTSVSPFQDSRTLLPVTVFRKDFKGSALIDWGAEGNFIDEKRAPEMGPILYLHTFIPHHCSFTSVSLYQAITGRSWIFFKSLAVPIVFGHPWLSLHGPHINWEDFLLCSSHVPQSATGLQQVPSYLSSITLTILRWSNSCHAFFLVCSWKGGHWEIFE